MNKTLFILLITLSTALNAESSNYQIKFNLDSFNDSVYYLASYYADKFQMIDTASPINNQVIFENDKNLVGGIYILAGQDKNKYIEFLLDKSQEFTISANANNIVTSLQVVNSAENELFFEYLKHNKIEYDKMNLLREKLEDTENNGNKDSISELIKHSNDKITTYRDDFIRDNPEALLSKIFYGMKDPEIDPDLNQADSYAAFKKSYWSNTDLTDPRMLRTPILHSRFINYFDKLILQHPDTLIKEIDILLNKEIHKEITKHFIWSLLLKYEYPDIMGLDKIFVYMVDNYVQANNISEISESIKSNLIKRSNKIRKVLIGEKAPELIMMDTSKQLRSLYELNKKFVIVLFWDQECQTCQEEIIQLKAILATQKYELDIYAVGTDGNIDNWKEYIKDNNLNWLNVNGTQSVTEDYHEIYDIYSTPTIYLLDEKRTIIAKRLSVMQLEEFFESYLRNN
ncbi:MAG: redoxin domain-containing protein [Bacteroidetes bacterium]|nr:redoxin domain-containing protein [Bacteroidota bacterium]